MVQTVKNAIATVSDKQKRTVWLRAFHIWQRRPHEVAPLSETVNTCASCGTVFQGNYCPRCGQSAKIGRFSFKKAFRLFLDVWGIGNRSMTRTIRDLLLRPGYMIRDYLNGMQSAYFPPFKMFFLLTALSLLVDHGFSLKDNTPVEEPADMNVTYNLFSDDEKPMTEQETKAIEGVGKAVSIVTSTLKKIERKNPAIFSLLILVLFYLPLYYFLRKSPVIPDLRYSEFIVALVYTSNMTSIYSILGNVLHSNLFNLIAVVMSLVAFRQLSGFSKLRLLRYVILTILISGVILIVMTSIIIFLVYVSNDGKTTA